MDTQADNATGNPLWDYALATYCLDGVADCCLALQDEFGIDVNVLLYAAWLAVLRRELSAAHLAALDAPIACWRDQVVKPLRAVRRQLSGQPLAAPLYNEIKELELRAERQQQDIMYAFYQQSHALPLNPAPLLNNLTLVLRCSHPTQQSVCPALTRLTALLAPQCGG